MEGYQNIVCATDFSDHCKAAAERAAELARHYGARLTLLHIVENFPEDRSNVEIAPEDVDPASYCEQKAREALTQLAQYLDYGKVSQEVRFSTHSARHGIVSFAEEQRPDLIVVASHSRHGINAILGSTAYGVTHHAPCDVMTIRAG